MSQILGKCLLESSRVVIGHIVLIASALDKYMEVAVMAVVDGREQMVLNLVVESAGESKRGIASMGEGVTGQNLASQLRQLQIAREYVFTWCL